MAAWMEAVELSALAISSNFGVKTMTESEISIPAFNAAARLLL
jgi:hypothetical protein